MTNYWQRTLDTDSTDGNSAPIVAELVRQVRDRTYTPPPWIQATQPVVTVPADQPTVKITQRTRSGYKDARQNALLTAVPLPPDVAVNMAPNSPDHSLCLYQPDTGRYWEFWELAPDSTGAWSCQWSGFTSDYPSFPGYFTSQMGSSASGLEIMAGLVTRAEIDAGHIPHRVALWLPNVRQGVWADPAQRTDGTDQHAHAVPYGARFCLPRSFDTSTIADPVARTLSLAWQQHGLVARDRTHYAVALDFRHGDDWGGVDFGRVMAHLPWEALQVRPMILKGPATQAAAA